MKLVLRLLLALVLFACVYALALFVMPSLARLVGLYRACPWLSGTSLVSQLTFFVASIILACILGKGDLSAYGWRWVRPRHLLRPIIVSTITMLILMSPMLVAMITGADPPDEGMRSKGPWIGGLPQTVLFVWIIASICEEVFYRGYMMTRIGDWLGQVLGLFSSSFLFGLEHFLSRFFRYGFTFPAALWTGITSTIGGLIFGWQFQKTKSIFPSLIAHITQNLFGYVITALILGA